MLTTTLTKRTLPLVLGAAVSLAGLCATPALAGEGVDEAVTAFNTWMREAREAETRLTYQLVSEKAAELLADIDVTTCSVAELRKLEGLTRYVRDMQDAISARYAELATADTVEGAQAAIASLQAAGRRVPAETIRMVLEHPKFDAALDGRTLGAVCRALSGVPAETLVDLKDEVKALAVHIDGDLDPSAMSSMTSYVEVLASMKDHLDRTWIDSVRTDLGSRLTAASKRMMEDPEQASMADRLDRAARFATSDAIMGELTGKAAPPITFSWYHDPANPEATPLRSLGDLKGKVVVIDFWATWCGPCIASFPNVAKLQERYNGYDVTILGVTSLQGRHFPKDGERIDCEGDPQKEYGLMPGLMKDHGMTWPVAFSDDDCFDPEYGVRGIPHVAIVDPSGIVRHRGLHPGSQLEKKFEMIDALLAEAELPAPAPVTTGEEKAGE